MSYLVSKIDRMISQTFPNILFMVLRAGFQRSILTSSASLCILPSEVIYSLVHASTWLYCRVINECAPDVTFTCMGWNGLHVTASLVQVIHNVLLLLGVMKGPLDCIQKVQAVWSMLINIL